MVNYFIFQEEEHIEMIVTEIRAHQDNQQLPFASHTTTGYTSTSAALNSTPGSAAPKTTPDSSFTSKTPNKMTPNKTPNKTPSKAPEESKIPNKTEKAENIHERQLKRQLKLRQFCRDKGNPPDGGGTGRERRKMMETKKMSMNFLYSDLQGIIYSYVPKAACTNWKRMLQVFDGNILHPLEISDKRLVHRLKYSHLNRLPRYEREWRRNLYYSFTFVRDPLERLLSVYRNKFLDPYSPTFQKRYGSQILKLFRTNLTAAQYTAGKDISFKEFIEYLIIIYDTKGYKYFDEHWQIMNKLCQPCTIKYNYIGKMETLLEDANQVLKEINLFDKVKFPANATDKYKLEVRTLMKKYYGTLTKKSINKLYQIYEDDFLAFGYKVPDYL